jgi:hypothetical protein
VRTFDVDVRSGEALASSTPGSLRAEVVPVDVDGDYLVVVV